MRWKLGFLAWVSALFLVACVATTEASRKIPAIASLSPGSIVAGSSGFTLTINGSNFGGNSVVEWNGSARPTTFLIPNQLRAAISAGDVAQPGSATVTVRNQPNNAGSSVSNAVSFTVVAGPLEVTTTSIPPALLQQSYVANLAVRGGVAPYRWSVSSGQLPLGLALGSTTGAISGRADQTGRFSFTALVTDAATPPKTDTQPLTLDVLTPLVIGTTGLPNGTVQVSYSATLAATGGTPPYTWSVVSGSLPPGLSLATGTGVVSGTPNASGQYSFSVQVKDSGSWSQSFARSFSVNIAAASAALQITTSNLPSGQVQLTYSAILSASGGTLPYTWSISSGALPPGLSLSSSTGAITGMPTSSGTFSFTVLVKDSATSAQTASAGLSINVVSGAPPGAPVPNLKVSFIGDQGAGSDSKAVLQLIKAEGTHIVLHQGDLDYQNNPDLWDTMITSILGSDFPYFVSVGNHDTSQWSGYQAKLLARLARIPEAICTGNLGVQSECHYKGLHFLLTAPGTMGSGHDTYIRDRLAADNSVWSVCSWHKDMNAMQVGSKGDETGWGVYEECRKGGAIVATAHEHSYERTKTLSSVQSQTVDPNYPDPSALYVFPGSTFVFVSGLGGQSIRNQDRCLPTTYPYGCQGEWAKIYTSDQGARPGALFIEFNVDGDPNKARGYFKNIDGQVVDSFVVRAGQSGTVAGTGSDTTPPIISGVSASNVTSSGATIAWTTDEPSDSQVEYGTTTAYGGVSALNNSLVTTHSVALSGLGSNTLYHYRVKSRDAAGNLGGSADFTFTTSAAVGPGPSSLLPAFPGAQGFGTETRGGRGGKVYYVTRLDDANELGTLRYALQASGPRMVLFRIAGTIQLQDDISIKNPYVTIAGQTAPGEGVQIKGGMIKIKTHDVIVRYLKMRPGDELTNSSNDVRDGTTLEAVNGYEAYNVVIDRCSIMWGPDAVLDIFNNSHHVTIQNSILAEGLYYSNHSEGSRSWGHSKGLFIAYLAGYGLEWPRYITIHHNLISTSSDRTPELKGAEFVDLVNNVLYNWGDHAPGGNPRSANVTKNFFISGPETTKLVAWQPLLHEPYTSLFPSSTYEQGNVIEGISVLRGDPQTVYASGRFSPYSMQTEDTPQAAYDFVVRGAGAILPMRDTEDQRIINNLVQRTGRFVSGVNYGLAWPILASGPVPVDNDGDGMPDDWELQFFGTTNRGSASDSSGDFDGDGYTDLEEYLNGTNPTVPDKP